jgi:hypothetical protein
MSTKPTIRVSPTDPIETLHDRLDAGRPASLTEDIKLLLKSPEAAEALSISERTLWDMTFPRGPIPVVKIGRAVRYSKKTLEEIVQALQEGGRS